MRRAPCALRVLLALPVVAFVLPARAHGAPPSGAAIYARHCAICHDRSGKTRAPARSVLATLTVERIIAVMTAGTMKPQAAELSASERNTLASFLSSKHGSADVGLAGASV